MGEAYFYHLTRSPLELALPMLLERSLGQGWRVVLRGTDAARLAWLDERLWAEGGEFLPHGLAGGPHDAIQPVLLTTQAEIPNGAMCLVSIDGAPVRPEEVGRLARTCVVFDGNDAAAVGTARGQWKQITEAGQAAQYWSEESGRWQKKAEKRA